MKAYWIYPETIKCYDEYDTKWVALCKALGYEQTQKAICLIPVEITN